MALVALAFPQAAGAAESRVNDMSFDPYSYNRRAVQPLVCLSEGWHLIKDQYWLFFGITAVGMLVGGAAPMGILMGPLFCGIHICFFERECNRPVSFDMLFRGFHYFGPSLIATLMMVVPMIVLILALDALFLVGVLSTIAAMRQGAGQPPDPAAGWLIVGLVALFTVAVTIISVLFNMLFYFTYPLIVDRGLSGFDAVKLSIRAAMGNFFGLAALLLLTQVLAFFGMFLCFVGIYLILPLAFAMTAVAYRQVFGMRNALDQFADEREPPPDELPIVGPLDTGIKGEPTSSLQPATSPDQPASTQG